MSEELEQKLEKAVADRILVEERRDSWRKRAESAERERDSLQQANRALFTKRTAETDLPEPAELARVFQEARRFIWADEATWESTPPGVRGWEIEAARLTITWLATGEPVRPMTPQGEPAMGLFNPDGPDQRPEHDGEDTLERHAALREAKRVGWVEMLAYIQVRLREQATQLAKKSREDVEFLADAIGTIDTGRKTLG